MHGILSFMGVGAILAGAGFGVLGQADLTELQREELIQAKEVALETLSEEEIDLLESLKGSKIHDLTDDEKEAVTEIKEKLHDATISEITDEDLLTLLEEQGEVKEAIAAARDAAYATLSEEDKSFLESIEGINRRDLTSDQRTQMRQIKEKQHTATLDFITDPKVLEAIEERNEMNRNHKGQFNRREM